MRATRIARTAAFAMALLLWGGAAAPPAFAASLPAPVLSITDDQCEALLEWTHSNPDNLNIYNFQYRVQWAGQDSWDSWNNISGGASARSVTVRSTRAAGRHSYQVRATANTVGSVVWSPVSNTVSAYLINYNSRFCQQGGE